MALSLSQINGRFQYLERPAALPGKCACCGAVDKPVIDFGFDLDFYGVIYLCVDCLGEAAQIALVNSASTGTETVPPPPINYEALDEYFRAVTKSLNAITNVLPAGYFDVPDSLLSEEDADGTDGEPTEVILDAPSDNVAKPELTVVEGPNDLSSDKRSEFTF